MTRSLNGQIGVDGRSLNGGNFLTRSNNLSDIPSPAIARVNLGLLGSVTAGSYITMSAYDGTSNQTISANASTTGEASKLVAYDASGVIRGNGSGLTSLNASTITTGTLASNRIPSLDASKITSGNLSLPVGSIQGLQISASTAYFDNVDVTSNFGPFSSGAPGTIRLRNNNVTDIASLSCNSFACTAQTGQGSGPVFTGDYVFITLDATRSSGGHKYVMFSTGPGNAGGSGRYQIYDQTTFSTVLDISSSGVISGNGSGLTNINYVSFRSLYAQSITTSSTTLANMVPLVSYTSGSSTTYRVCVPYTYCTGDTAVKVSYAFGSTFLGAGSISLYTGILNSSLGLINQQTTIVSSLKIASINQNVVMSIPVSTLSLVNGTKYYIIIADYSASGQSYTMTGLEINAGNQ